jgi:flagellar motility protein MotE (MotC chaperone)
MIRILQSKWTASLVGAVAFMVTMVLTWRPVAPSPADEDHTAPVSRAPAPSWAFHNPEVDLLISELKIEKESLAAKEKGLADLAARLATERAELGQVTQSVQQLQLDFDQKVTRVREEEGVNLKKLAKTYAAMSPEGAATIFKALDDAAIVKVMMFMRESETAPILEGIAAQSEADAKRMAGISERIRLGVNETKKATTR